MPQFCSSCGAQMSEGSAVCAACGKAMAQPAGGGAVAAPAAQAGGLDKNIAGALAYLFIPAIIFLVLEPYNRDRYIRFHSFQGLLIGAAFFALNIVLGITFILAILIPFVSLAHLIVVIVCAVKAYQGQKFMLPVIGGIAETQANK